MAMASDGSGVRGIYKRFKPHILMVLTQIGYAFLYLITKASFNHGLEKLDVRNPRGVAKVLGTLISLAGVMAMTLYKGSLLRNLWHPLIRIQGSAAAIHESWLKGSILAVASCISWSIFYIMQVMRNISSCFDALSQMLS
ncbi:hypothetical protein Ancab_013143 [Ancistrocladus abbreviatus]